MNHGFRTDVWVSIIIILTGLLTFGLLAVWLGGSMEDTAADIVQARTNIHNRLRLVEILADFKRIEPDVAAYEKGLQDILPPKDRLLDFSGSLNDLARRHEASLTFAFQEESIPEGSDAPAFVSFVLNVGGSYTNVEALFRELEGPHSRFVVRLTTLDLQRVGGQYRAIAQGKVFFRREITS